MNKTAVHVVYSLQLGYKPGDPLSVDVVSKVDQMHYYGTRAIDEAVGIIHVWWSV